MNYASDFAVNGIAIIEHALAEHDLGRMSNAFTAAGVVAGSRQHTMSPDLIDWLSSHPSLKQLANHLAAAPVRLVRVIAFDKTPAANWFVPWHQDRSIAVAGRVERPGYNNWTIKGGLIQVEPPVAVLEGMVTLRLHLDDTNEDNGPLEVVPGSHAAGRLDRDAVAAIANRGPLKLCLANRGDILAMRPLLVHRSQRARSPARRRVLHLEYASTALAAGLQWALPNCATA